MRNDDVLTSSDSLDETEEPACPAFVPSASDEQNAKSCLFALVSDVNTARKCGYTAAQMEQMVKNLYHTCCNQVQTDFAGYKNRRSPIHGELMDAVIEMCRLGIEKKEKFNPQKASFSTFMITVFTNHCNTGYNNRSRDARYHADSIYAPVSADEDAATMEDLIGTYDPTGEIENLNAAEREACRFLMEYAATHMSADEYKVFLNRLMEGKTNPEIAAELGIDKKSVENAFYRALVCLRRDARDELDAMLWKKFGFRNRQDMSYNAYVLRSGEELFLGNAA